MCLMLCCYAAEHELQGQLASLPVRTDTMRLRQCKSQLDTKLQEVEEAIRIFSRRKVFVRLDQ